jgi:hypothetical protein
MPAASCICIIDMGKITSARPGPVESRSASWRPSGQSWPCSPYAEGGQKRQWFYDEALGLYGDEARGAATSGLASSWRRKTDAQAVADVRARPQARLLKPGHW